MDIIQCNGKQRKKQKVQSVNFPKVKGFWTIQFIYYAFAMEIYQHEVDGTENAPCPSKFKVGRG